jgi:cytochrome c553
MLLSAGVLALGASSFAADTNPAVPAFANVDSMEARVQGCVTCHGQQGQGTNNDYFPRIAGKPAGYLYNQLIAFRDGRRRYAPMNYLVATLSDEYLREMADYFASLRPAFQAPPATPVASDLLDRGRTIVSLGDELHQIPPCVSCHGARLTGMQPGIPGLAGLRANYISAQLTRWRTGERSAAEPDCMKRVASRLNERDIAAVAAWLGSAPPPTNVEPEPRNTQRMPIACGSQR